MSLAHVFSAGPIEQVSKGLIASASL